jgi:hypothetical protein
MSQPKWEFIANLGDANPIEYGGYFLYKDSTGAYDFEAELLEEPEDADSKKAKWTVRRVCLDRCKLQRSEDGERIYLVSYAYDPATYPHALSQYAEWFAKDLDGVASTIGSTREELEHALCAEDGGERAWAYRAIADTYGWDNFDSYPLFLTKEEVEARYTDGELGDNYALDDAVSLKSEHTREGRYALRAVHCLNAGQYGADAKPGDLIQFAYPSSPDHVNLARVLARVDAPSEGPNRRRMGWLAVVELSVSLGSAFVRWIDPAWVKSCGKIPQDMLAWFFADKLPGLPAILKLDSLGALSDHYVAKYKGSCERCICTHQRARCSECGGSFTVSVKNGVGVTEHDGDTIDGIDHEKDADHTAYEADGSGWLRRHPGSDE